MDMSFIVGSMLACGDADCVVSKDSRFTFADVHAAYEGARAELDSKGVGHGAVVAVRADYSAESIAMLVALIEIDAVVVPIAASVLDVDTRLGVSEAEWLVDLTVDEVVFEKREVQVRHPMLRGLKEAKHPGLILFSSGTTGAPKAAVHDLSRLMERYKRPGKTLKTITFLLFDHIGGFNTVMHALANGGTVVTLAARTPQEACELIERECVELLPTSPTFLNMILLNGMAARYDLSSLKIISYGTEPMPQSTLDAFAELLPKVRMKQTYGLSELGIMSTKSESSTSLWLKVGGEGFETKVVDGILYIRAETAMIGYLNAVQPFDEDGWFCTQDHVEVREDGYMRILGRVTDLINVGGEKVYPIEVESALLKCPGVLEAHVFGEESPITGEAVVADIQVAPENATREFKKALRRFALGRLEKYMRPVRYNLTTESLSTERFKKVR